MHIHTPHVHTHLGHVHAHRSNTHEQHKVKTHQVARVKGPGSPSERSREGCALGTRRGHTLVHGRLPASRDRWLPPVHLFPPWTQVRLMSLFQLQKQTQVSHGKMPSEFPKPTTKKVMFHTDKCHGSCARTRVGTRARASPHGLLLSELLGPAPRRGVRGARDRLLPHGITLLRTGSMQPRPDPHGATTTEAPGTEFPASLRSPHCLQGCRVLPMLLCPGPRLVPDIPSGPTGRVENPPHRWCGKGQTSGTPSPDVVGRSLCKGSLSKGVRLTMNPGKNSNKTPIVAEILHVLRNRGLAVYSEETDHVLRQLGEGQHSRTTGGRLQGAGSAIRGRETLLT